MKFYPSTSNLWTMWSISVDHSKYGNDYRLFEATYYLEHKDEYYLTDSDIKHYQLVFKCLNDTNKAPSKSKYVFGKNAIKGV